MRDKQDVTALFGDSAVVRRLCFSLDRCLLQPSDFSDGPVDPLRHVLCGLAGQVRIVWVVWGSVNPDVPFWYRLADLCRQLALAKPIVPFSEVLFDLWCHNFLELVLGEVLEQELQSPAAA